MNNNSIKEFIEGMPKAELHLHIEGTFEPELMFEIARRNNIRIKYAKVDELIKIFADYRATCSIIIVHLKC